MRGGSWPGLARCRRLLRSSPRADTRRPLPLSRPVPFGVDRGLTHPALAGRPTRLRRGRRRSRQCRRESSRSRSVEVLSKGTELVITNLGGDTGGQVRVAAVRQQATNPVLLDEARFCLGPPGVLVSETLDDSIDRPRKLRKRSEAHRRAVVRAAVPADPQFALVRSRSAEGSHTIIVAVRKCLKQCLAEPCPFHRGIRQAVIVCAVPKPCAERAAASARSIPTRS